MISGVSVSNFSLRQAEGESRKGENRGVNKKTWCTEFEAREAYDEKNGKWSLSRAAGNVNPGLQMQPEEFHRGLLSTPM